MLRKASQITVMTALYLQLKDVSLRLNSKPFGGLANFQKIFKRFKWRLL